ncbi:MAG: hypothetical protein FJY91_00760 [Candidatus Harrisonbacteria bacterium]|nr:hypothetical protein [Candidatus Harrisonbacteria bacterium]
MIFSRLLFLIVFIPFFSPAFVFAYELSAHERLTRAIIDSINNSSSFSLSESEAEALVKGVLAEDNLPRPLNHFYDPVHKKGLSLGTHIFESAKRWANDPFSQRTFTKSNFLTRRLFNAEDNIFTYNRALELYKQGKKIEAYEHLGHVLHLVEDMGVPDHTRNDAHPAETSPYENFTKDAPLPYSKKYLNTIAPRRFSSLDAVFVHLARYSNSSFFSEDTILSEDYPAPIPKGIKKVADGYEYAYRTDENGVDYLLYRRRLPSLSSFIGNDAYTEFNTLKSLPVLEDYYAHLSREVIASGLGLFSLFLKDVGEPDLSFIPKVSLSDPALSLIDSASSSPAISLTVEREKEYIPVFARAPEDNIAEFSALLASTPKVLEVFYNAPPVIPLILAPSTSSSLASSSTTSLTSTSTASSFSSLTIADSENSSSPASSTLASTTPLISGSALISEVFFDAEGSDTGKEFIELFNPGETAFDLSLASLQFGELGGTIKKKNFELGNSIPPHGFFLITIGEGDARDGKKGDMLYKSGSLKNASDTIRLVADQISLSASSTILDSFHYDIRNFPNFTPGASLERATLLGPSSSDCVRSQGDAEYSGHFCPAPTFYLRSLPHSQNFASFKEPRAYPEEPISYAFTFDSATRSLNLSLSSINPFSYKINLIPSTDFFYPSSASQSFSTTTSVSAIFPLSTLGHSLTFEINLTDEEGFSLPPILLLYNSPSLLSHPSYIVRDDLGDVADLNFSLSDFTKEIIRTNTSHSADTYLGFMKPGYQDFIFSSSSPSFDLYLPFFESLSPSAPASYFLKISPYGNIPASDTLSLAIQKSESAIPVLFSRLYASSTTEVVPLYTNPSLLLSDPLCDGSLDSDPFRVSYNSFFHRVTLRSCRSENDRFLFSFRPVNSDISPLEIKNSSDPFAVFSPLATNEKYEFLVDLLGVDGSIMNHFSTTLFIPGLFSRFSFPSELTPEIDSALSEEFEEIPPYISLEYSRTHLSGFLTEKLFNRSLGLIPPITSSGQSFIYPYANHRLILFTDTDPSTLTPPDSLTLSKDTDFTLDSGTLGFSPIEVAYTNEDMSLEYKNRFPYLLLCESRFYILGLDNNCFKTDLLRSYSLRLPLLVKDEVTEFSLLIYRLQQLLPAAEGVEESARFVLESIDKNRYKKSAE